MRVERTAKTVIAGLMSVACLASVAACGPGSSSNKANTETEAVSTDLGDTKYECFASMFVRQVRQCFSVVWADGFPRCRHRFPVM